MMIENPGSLGDHTCSQSGLLVAFACCWSIWVPLQNISLVVRVVITLQTLAQHFKSEILMLVEQTFLFVAVRKNVEWMKTLTHNPATNDKLNSHNQLPIPSNKLEGRRNLANREEAFKVTNTSPSSTWFSIRSQIKSSHALAGAREGRVHCAPRTFLWYRRDCLEIFRTCCT